MYATGYCGRGSGPNSRPPAAGAVVGSVVACPAAIPLNTNPINAAVH